MDESKDPADYPKLKEALGEGGLRELERLIRELARENLGEFLSAAQQAASVRWKPR